MSEPILPTRTHDVVTSAHPKVSCEGPAESRHPRVWLTMTDDADGTPSHVVCPYCSRIFRYQSGLAPAPTESDSRSRRAEAQTPAKTGERVGGAADR